MADTSFSPNYDEVPLYVVGREFMERAQEPNNSTQTQSIKGLALRAFQNAAEAGNPLAHLRCAELIMEGVVPARETPKGIETIKSTSETLPARQLAALDHCDKAISLSKRDDVELHESVKMIVGSIRDQVWEKLSQQVDENILSPTKCPSASLSPSATVFKRVLGIYQRYSM